MKCKLKHLENGKIVATGSVYKSNGKQMLHNKPLPNDCYKVSIESSIVDAAFIPDVANNGKKTVMEGIGCFLAWPKDLVVMQEEVHIYMCFFNLHIYNSSYLIQCLIQASFVYYRLHHQLRYQKLVKKILDQKSQGSEKR